MPTSPRHFGQLPDLAVPDDFGEPLPPPEAAVWEANDPAARDVSAALDDDWPIDDLDDWPFDDPSVDVARLRESLLESEVDTAAGRTFSEEEIRTRYGLPRSDTGSAEQETTYLLASPENACRLREAIARDKTAGK